MKWWAVDGKPLLDLGKKAIYSSYTQLAATFGCLNNDTWNLMPLNLCEDHAACVAWDQCESIPQPYPVDVEQLINTCGYH